MKKVLAGAIITIAATLTSMALLTGPTAAERPPTVNHPDCPSGWTQIVDQPPFEGLTVTAAYSGTLWIKVATEHFEVPVVSVGDVITPQAVSSWPTNRNGQFQEVSHVDYCIPPTTETTVPETTVPETTVPETTVPETTVPETTVPETTVPETTIPDECWLDSNPLTVLPSGQFVLMDPDDPGAVGSHSRTGIPCGPPSEDTTTTQPPVVRDRMPETGSDPWSLALAAVVSLMFGGSALWVARR